MIFPHWHLVSKETEARKHFSTNLTSTLTRLKKIHEEKTFNNCPLLYGCANDERRSTDKIIQVLIEIYEWFFDYFTEAPCTNDDKTHRKRHVFYSDLLPSDDIFTEAPLYWKSFICHLHLITAITSLTPLRPAHLHHYYHFKVLCIFHHRKKSLIFQDCYTFFWAYVIKVLYIFCITK